MRLNSFNDYKESAKEIKTIVKPLYTIVSTKVNIKVLDENGDFIGRCRVAIL